MQDKKSHEPISSPYLASPESREVSSSTRFQEYISWSGTPPQFRKIETESEFARSIGVSLEVLETWRQHPVFTTLKFDHLEKWIRARTPELVGALFERISENNDAYDIGSFIRLGWPYQKY